MGKNMFGRGKDARKDREKGKCVMFREELQ